MSLNKLILIQDIHRLKCVISWRAATLFLENLKPFFPPCFQFIKATIFGGESDAFQKVGFSVPVRQYLEMDKLLKKNK